MATALVDVLRQIREIYAREREAIGTRRSLCQWWVSGRNPDGQEQHYLIRAGAAVSVGMPQPAPPLDADASQE